MLQASTSGSDALSKGHVSLLQCSECWQGFSCPLSVQLSQARKQEGAAPTDRELRHTGSSTTTASSRTTSSSLYTSSMSSTDTVLPKNPAASLCPNPGSLRKRMSADTCAPLVSLLPCQAAFWVTHCKSCLIL